ncbi:TPA: type II secretion system minor pseudopilin GspK [Escherichia coli]|nr:type II secretion system minor pseudopilin GspK [Escherichia coli]
MINRQQGFTLLEVMAALAIFSMLSVLAFMIFSQASELHQRSQKEIQQFNQLQRTITILDNDLLQLVARRNRSTDKIMVLGEEAIFTTQSRDPLAPLSEAQTLLTVHWYLRNHTLYRAVRTSVDGRKDQPAQVFSALLINAGIDRGNTDEIVQSIADYIDADDSPRFHGAEDNFYQSQTPPRHSANQMLFLTGELRQIKGITENIYQRLIPYVCVLPTSELSINLNMLTENDIPLFRALFLNNITDADARVLLQKRPGEGWLTTDAFLYWAQQDFSGVKPLVAQVKGHLFPYSRYFTLSTESISDEQSQGWQSHIFFNRKQQSAQIYRRTLQLY